MFHSSPRNYPSLIKAESTQRKQTTMLQQNIGFFVLLGIFTLHLDLSLSSGKNAVIFILTGFILKLLPIPLNIQFNFSVEIIIIA